MPTTFLHRDEFLRKLKTHPHDFEDAKFPAVFLEKEGRIRVLITREEINRCESLRDLMDLITVTLSKL